MPHVEDADSLRSEEVVEEHLFCRVITRLGYRGSILTIRPRPALKRQNGATTATQNYRPQTPSSFEPDGMILSSHTIIHHQNFQSACGVQRGRLVWERNKKKGGDQCL